MAPRPATTGDFGALGAQECRPMTIARAKAAYTLSDRIFVSRRRTMSVSLFKLAANGRRSMGANSRVVVAEFRAGGIFGLGSPAPLSGRGGCNPSYNWMPMPTKHRPDCRLRSIDIPKLTPQPTDKSTLWTNLHEPPSRCEEAGGIQHGTGKLQNGGPAQYALCHTC